MSSWSGVFVGDYESLSTTDMPMEMKEIVLALLGHYPGEPVAERVHRRAKDPSRPIETAQSSDGSTHAVGNFEDVTIRHIGKFRVTLHGNPDDYGVISILIEPDFSNAEIVEKI